MPRFLFFSGSMGLGHVTRDVVIADEIRELRSDVEIDWIATSPAREYLAERGERVLSVSDTWGDPTGQAEIIAVAGRGLNLSKWAMGLRKGWAKTGQLSLDLMKSGGYDFAIGDETYDLAIALASEASSPSCPCFILFDFLGMDTMTHSPIERLVTIAFNRVWSRDPRGRYQPVFLGELDDIPPRSFGPLLPDRRAWAERHALIVGHVLTFDPAEYNDRAAVRARLGYGSEPLVLVSTGGTAVGGELLRFCLAAFPYARQRIPNLHMVVVCGPRLSVPDADLPEGAELRGYVPKLYEHFAACDLAIVQGGGTSLLELTVLNRPFLYFPLTNHFEQMIHVVWRQQRLGAGVMLLARETKPESLAERIAAEIRRQVSYPALNTNGGRNLAELVLRRLG
jgi:spore coat polysaccharide biosynthesis predicted glycosyltransferase SpsG